MSINLQKQPFMLYLVSFVSLWERYGFYTMQSIVVLYMTKIFLFSNVKAYSVFAIFSAFFYLMPVVGGYIADRFLDAKKCILWGGLILAAGYALLSLPGTEYFYLALSTVSVGGGLFIPNIASMVSHLYSETDSRRDGGFSIFYTAINVGSFFPPLITAYIIYRFNWSTAFVMAACSVLFSVVIAFFYLPKQKKQGEVYSSWASIISVIVMLALSIFFITLLLNYTGHANAIIFAVSILFVGFAFYKSFFYSLVERKKLLACLFLIILSIVFSVLYQQAAMSLTIYTEYNVQRGILHWSIPTIVFRSLNPFFIFFLGPLLAKCWLELSKRYLNPSISVKFGLGTCAMGLGFVVLPLAILVFAHDGKISFWWIVLSYFLQTLGEMLVSPIGLSMISELSPIKMLGLMMGVWYFATAVADALAGFVSIWTTVPSGSNDPIITSSAYAHTFGLIGVVSVVVGIFILLVSPLCCKMIGKKTLDV